MWSGTSPVGSVLNKKSRATFPILSRDPSSQEASNNPGETAGVEKNDG